MFSIVSITVLSSFFLLIFLRYPAKKINLIDKPNYRKLHNKDTLLTGGIAIYFSIALSLILSPSLSTFYINLMLISSTTIVIGALDDIYDISALFRILFQVLIAYLAVIILDIRILSFGNILGLGEFVLGGFSTPITVFSIVACINAINFIDGLDGLAGTQILIALFGIVFFLISSKNQSQDMLFSFTLIAALMTFLLFNLGLVKNFETFLGDSGSFFLGLVLSVLLINFSQSPINYFNPVTAIWLIALPLIDSLYVILKRVYSGQKPMKADNLHIHFRLKKSGISDKKILSLLSLLSILVSFCGIILDITNIEEIYSFVAFLFLIFLFFLINLKFFEEK